MATNDSNIKLTGSLDVSKTKARLNQDIDTIKKSLKAIQLTIDNTSIHNDCLNAKKEISHTLKDQFSQAADSFSQWFSVNSAITAVINQLKKMPEAVKELDNAVTYLTMSTGESKAQIQSYMDSYVKLGDKLNTAVTDITISGTEWLKQGENIADTEALITDAIILSKVGSMSSADATKYLTSVRKGYNVAVEDTLDIVDKLSAVDMASTADISGLAKGISDAANNANLAGISIDKLLGYLAAVGEATQLSMSEVGTSLNAIFSRMGNIKLSRLIDYDTGEDLSNVENVLSGEGITLRDSIGEFRNFGEVLDEVANRWSSFNSVSQRTIANAFSGTNNMENFLVLMSNYDTALKYTETSLNSSGQAMEKFQVYQDSIVGHTEKLENAFINLSNTVINSELLKGLTDLGTTGIKAVDSLINALTPLGTVGLGAGLFAGIKNVGVA